MTSGMRFVQTLTLALLLFAWSGCAILGDERPPLSDSTFVEVLADLHLVQARGQIEAEERQAEPSDVLAAHEVEEEDLDRTLEYYAERPEELEEIYRRVIERLNEERGLHNGPRVPEN